MFNSSAARVRVSFWRLAPRPQSESVSSSNLTVRFTLEPVTHSDITSVAVQVATHCVCVVGVVCVGVVCVGVDGNLYYYVVYNSSNA